MQSVMQMGLSDPDPLTRANAAVYLAAHIEEDPLARETLEQIARNDTNVRVRKAAAEALQQIE
jgi:HEAT repeat protein